MTSNSQSNPSNDTILFEKIRNLAINLSGESYIKFKEYIDIIFELKPEIVKQVFDHDFYGTILTTYRDNDNILQIVEIGKILKVDLMDTSKDHSVLQRVIKYPARESRKKLVEKIFELCIQQNRTKFQEIIKKSELSDFHKITIINLMWKSQGKSVTKNFDELINYINSGVQISGSTIGGISISTNLTLPGTAPYITYCPTQGNVCISTPSCCYSPNTSNNNNS